MTAETVLHAYGVVPREARVDLPAAGIDGATVEIVEAGGLAALVSRLDAARYGAESWRAHGDDPRWLTEFATQHQAVLGSVIASCDVLPFRIPGMYDDEAGLLRVLRTDGDHLGRALAAVHDHVEWGVKVFWASRAEASPTARPRSGRDYLRAKSEAAGSRERAADERRAQVVDAYHLVAEAAARSVANPPQDAALTGRDEPMLLNSAHLVRRDGEATFFAALAAAQGQLRGTGMVVEVSGPWPPYNFVDVAGERQGATA